MNKKAVFPVLIIGMALVFLIMNLNRFMKKDNQNSLLSEGMKAPDIELRDVKNNELVKLSSLRGQVVMVNFWASWCQPCREEMQSVHNLNKIMAANKNFRMLTIVFNENPAVSVEYLRKTGFDIPVYADPGGRAAVNFGLTGVPETYIISKDGTLSMIKIGPDRWDSKANVNFIAGLLQ